MDQQMRIVGRAMSIRMGILMSFCLSLVGTLSSGHFTIPGFLISFIVSTFVSLVIGFLVPIAPICGGACRKLGLQRGSLGARLLETFISDLIYTPIMTFAMVFLAYQMAMKQSNGAAGLDFGPMFLSSLLICFLVAYVLIFIFQPLFLKRVMGRLEKKDL